MPRLPRCDVGGLGQGAPGPAVRYRQLRAVPQSAPVSSAASDADLYASTVCRWAVRHLPQAGEGRQSCPDARPDVKAICVTCHSDQAEKIEKAKVQHPGAQGDCTTCHNPHAGRSPGFLQPDPVNVCLSCHTDIAELEKKAVHHQPAFQQGCAICHEPHGSRQCEAAACQWQRTLSRMSRARFEAAAGGIRAGADHFQRAGEDCRRTITRRTGS